MTRCFLIFGLILNIPVATYCFVIRVPIVHNNACVRQGCRSSKVSLVGDTTAGVPLWSPWFFGKTPWNNPSSARTFRQLDVANGQQKTDGKISVEENVSVRSESEGREARKEQYQTLYELLQVPSNATREEIKQSYIKMAKLTHPDALGASSNKNDGGEKFSEIASSYKLLSDPRERKRYDRSLVAESFKREVERAASELGKSAGPQFFALLRRTGVTTKAVIESALKELQQKPTIDTDIVIKASEVNSTAKNPPQLTKVLNSALKAGQDASRVIDKLEMAEKGRSLEIRARKELTQANMLRQKASDVAQQRLLVALYTPKSGFSSLDARAILQQLNYTDLSFSFLDNMLAKRSLDVHIQRLENMEKDYNESIAMLNSIESEYRICREAFDQSVTNLNYAIEVRIMFHYI
jgi:curved DNA-binding protein CbpA